MDKKEYILTILIELLDVWPLAKDLKVLIESDGVNDKVLDSLVNIFKDAIKTIDSKEKRERLEKTINMISKIKQEEAESNKAESQKLSELDNIIENI